MTKEQGLILIDDSEETRDEMLGLNVERMRDFDIEEAGIYGIYFDGLFGYITAVYDGKCDVMPEINTDGLPLCLEFWAYETKSLLSCVEEVKKQHLLMCCETSLFLFFTVKSSISDGEALQEKSLRDIIYSAVYDYSGDLLREQVLFNTEPCGFVCNFIFNEKSVSPEFPPLFMGDRLKAKLLSELSDIKKEYPDEFSAVKGRINTSFRELPGYTPHQKSVTEELKTKLILLLMCILALFAFTGCGGEKKKEEEEETTEARRILSDEYPDICEVTNEDGSTRDIFGVMYAGCLMVQDDGEGHFIYTLRDDADPENAWSIESRLVGDIFTEVEKGSRVAVLFSGDIVDDPDNVVFISILPDRECRIKHARGTIINNIIDSFTMLTEEGREITFKKDNCLVDRDALSTESGDTILVYYADCGYPEMYPFRVYNESK